MTAVLLMFLTACSSGDTESADETKRTVPPTPITPIVTHTPEPSEPEPSEDEPETALLDCRAALEDKLIAPETVTFEDRETYVDRGTYWRITGTASSATATGEAMEFQWACNATWRAGEWGVGSYIPDAYQVEREREDEPVSARGRCYDAIRGDLVAPRDAEFEFTGGNTRNNKITIEGTVDAQNRMGTFVRHYWTCEVEWLPSLDQWKVVRKTLI